MNEIIPEHPQYQTEYLDAARTWRLPYWDWAKNPQVPKFARWKRLEITIGGNPPTTIDNPLYQFKMPNNKKMGAYGVGILKYPDGDEFIDVGANTRYFFLPFISLTWLAVVWGMLCN